MEEDIFACNIVEFETLESTNLHAIENWERQAWDEGTVVWAKRQTAGVGQSGNKWLSEAGKNLTFSIVLKPSFLPAASQFDLHKVLAVAVRQTVSGFAPDSDVRIKWPNDIYVGDRKVCGILVNNVITDNLYRVAVAGIGINVNQTDFAPELPNPTSLKLECGTDFEIDRILDETVRNIGFWYGRLKKGDMKLINETYFSQMLNFGTPKRYRYRGKTVEATITGLDRFGRMVLQTNDNRQIVCDIKEIEYIF